MPHIMEDFPESFIKLDILHPADRESFRLLHRKLQGGEKDAMLEYRVKMPGEDYCWLLAHYTNSFDEEGHAVRAFATAERIDRYKELEEQFTVAARLTGVRVWTLEMQNGTITYCFYRSPPHRPHDSVGHSVPSVVIVDFKPYIK